MMSTPYDDLDSRAYWRPAISDRHALAISELWRPANPVTPNDTIVTFGSCFAQHISRALTNRGYNWLDTEPAPPGMGSDDAKSFNYGIFSARTGNIYTSNLLRQWTDWALGISEVDEELWEDENGRWYDPFRPNIEPNGFASAEEAAASRRTTVDAFRRAILEPNVFVFTMGLTEHWKNSETGVVYPMCPGTAAGTFSRDKHKFGNEGFSDVFENMLYVISRMRGANSSLRFFLTVSPVPLTATASGNHILPATTYSKSVLRAAAEELSTGMHADHVDYFPSYEIITAPAFRGMWFEPNMRSVAMAGVNFVMQNFFESDRPATKESVLRQSEEPSAEESELLRDDLVCEEEILAQQ